MKRDHGAVGEDIRGLEEQLKTHLNQWILNGGGGDAFVALPLAAVPLGEAAVLLLVDAAWGALGADGKLRRSAAASGTAGAAGRFFEVQVPEEVRGHTACAPATILHPSTLFLVSSLSLSLSLSLYVDRCGAASSPLWLTPRALPLLLFLRPRQRRTPAAARHSGCSCAPRTRCCCDRRPPARACSACPAAE
jgi:hypothetical protein